MNVRPNIHDVVDAVDLLARHCLWSNAFRNPIGSWESPFDRVGAQHSVDVLVSDLRAAINREYERSCMAKRIEDQQRP